MIAQHPNRVLSLHSQPQPESLVAGGALRWRLRVGDLQLALPRNHELPFGGRGANGSYHGR